MEIFFLFVLSINTPKEATIKNLCILVNDEFSLFYG